MTETSRPTPDAARRVLVTGAYGNVGRHVVRALLDAGHDVVATDLDTRANRKRAATFAGARFRPEWTDLRDAAAVTQLIATCVPDVVVHLAAVIPPACYAVPELAREVTVEGTRHLVQAAEAAPRPPRFVLASSIAVHGPRNPHTTTDLLTADTPLAPTDVYGAHKAAAEGIVRASSLDWVILRLGGVLTVESDRGLDLDIIHFAGLLPTDGRIQTVDVRDVARAFAAAVHADCVGETLMVGGDSTHAVTQGEITAAFTDARGLEGGIPAGLPGDPARDESWFATDWMDTTRAQEVLDFQRHSWPQMLAEIRASARWSRFLARLVAPPLHAFLQRRSAYRDTPEGYADPWAAIAAEWGDPRPPSDAG